MAKCGWVERAQGWRKEVQVLFLISYHLAEYGLCSTSLFQFLHLYGASPNTYFIHLAELLRGLEEIKGVKVLWRVESTLSVMSLLKWRQPLSSGCVPSSATGLLNSLNLFMTQFFQLLSKIYLKILWSEWYMAVDKINYHNGEASGWPITVSHPPNISDYKWDM